MTGTQSTDGVRESVAPADDQASLDAQLSEALTRASWRLRRTSVKELAPLGLTFAQSRVLRILARRGEPMRMGDLAARFEVAPRSATSMIDTLENAGLVERQADPCDRRSVLVGLTPEGLALMERVRNLRRAAAESLFAGLTQAERENLLTLLQSLWAPHEGCGASADDQSDGAASAGDQSDGAAADGDQSDGAASAGDQSDGGVLAGMPSAAAPADGDPSAGVEGDRP